MTVKARQTGSGDSFFESATQERLLHIAPVTFYEDFLGAWTAAIPAAAAPGLSPWVQKIVGAAPPVIAGIAGANGVVALSLTADSQKQDAALYWGDNLSLNTGKPMGFEARVRLATLPVGASLATWGLSTAWIDGPANAAGFITFSATAGGAVTIKSYDGTTTTSVASGVTVLAADYHLYRIDVDVNGVVRAFIDGVEVPAAPPIATLAAALTLQPYFSMYRAAVATTAGAMYVDSVRTWGARA